MGVAPMTRRALVAVRSTATKAPEVADYAISEKVRAAGPAARVLRPPRQPGRCMGSTAEWRRAAWERGAALAERAGAMCPMAQSACVGPGRRHAGGSAGTARPGRADGHAPP
jgi:hypothetical protein